MIYSMTGFGSGACEMNGKKFSVEIKSVNHRYLDIFIKMPAMLNCFDDRIKKLIGEYASRGKFDVYITFADESYDSVKVDVNLALAKAYIEAINEIGNSNGISSDVSASFISRLPDVIKPDNAINDEDALFAPLEAALRTAMESLRRMRQREGEKLREDLLDKRETMIGIIDKIDERAPFVVEEYRTKLDDRIRHLLEGKTVVDESRLAVEVALFADKCAIDEELTRLRSHMEQFRLFLEADKPIGRKLDFLVQEMNREANTIGSKSNDLVISNAVIDLKGEIEKIREQVQNIE